MKANRSLIAPGVRHGTDGLWSRRGGETARIWTLAISIAIHLSFVYFARDWLEVRILDSPESPFVVSLAAPLIKEQPVPAVPEPEAEPEETVAAPSISPPVEETSEKTAGMPEATPLLPDPVVDSPLDPPKEEPIPGDTIDVEHEEVEFIRSDIAGDLTRRLLEQSAPAPEIPISDQNNPIKQPDADRARSETGADAGITGPLGKRGLLYSEQPVYPEQMQTAGFENELLFEILVSPAGNVINIVTLRKSGQSDWESAARLALLRWRFEPLPQGTERIESGKVPIIYDLTSR